MEGHPQVVGDHRLAHLGVTADVVAAVARRPSLWSAAIGAVMDLAPAGWWRQPPFLPLPDDDWLRFRLETAYGGDGTGPIRSEDLITWLEWRASLT